MSGAREDDAIALVIQNQVGHADEHVFLDIGIKLPVNLSQDVGRGRISSSLSSQDAAANRHNKRRGHTFARNIRNCHAKPLFIDLDVIEIIATYLASRHTNAADLKSINGRRFRRQ